MTLEIICWILAYLGVCVALTVRALPENDGIGIRAGDLLLALTIGFVPPINIVWAFCWIHSVLTYLCNGVIAYLVSKLPDDWPNTYVYRFKRKGDA